MTLADYPAAWQMFDGSWFHLQSGEGKHTAVSLRSAGRVPTSVQNKSEGWKNSWSLLVGSLTRWVLGESNHQPVIEDDQKVPTLN